MSEPRPIATGLESPAVAAARPVPRYRRLRRLARPVLQHAVLAMVAILFVIPIYWMVSSALKTTADIQATPPIWWPSALHWENFSNVLTNPDWPFLRYLWNSTFYAGAVTIGTVLSCATVGYGFARLRFRGSNFIFFVVLATMMIPHIITFMPTYVLFKSLGLLGTYAPLIIPSFLCATPGVSALFVFMLRQFYMGLPWELSEAAKIDGAGEWRIFWQIMLPLVRSALIVVAVFTFVWTWHEFLGPLIYLTDPNKYPLSVALFSFRNDRQTDWALVMAASTIFTVPLVVLFFCAQRYFLQNVTLVGIKG